MAVSTHSSRLVTGAEYEQAITASDSDRRARSAFQDLVSSIAAPGAALFDFGAGTGIDARVYAERGYTVGAYDVDPRMRRYFALRCRELIDAGRITTYAGSYAQFLACDARSAGRQVALITSNFAPLNLIADLPPLFEKFHALTAPGGRVLVSVLNPYFIGDSRYRWWWRNGLRLWRVGHFAVAGAQAAIMRRRLADFARNSAPYFELARVYPGLPRRGAPAAGGIDVTRDGRFAWLHLLTCRFMFLLFERRSMDGHGGADHRAHGPSSISSTNDARSRA
ncbi:MAG TPA: methyltransferase domain-containing protein [Steroidobacteraceae bacterium]|jgi:SAM-dependent methyltransferase|nr:methyltransferase domain-containing protein [Steroidobacteraceae bacterium]